MELTSVERGATPSDEEARLRALNDTHVLDRGAEYRFDRLTRLCTQLFKVPLAYIVFIDRDTPRVKSHAGEITRSRGGRDVSFANMAIQRPGLFVVEDAQSDPTYANNPYVAGEPFLRFFAAHPIESQGQRVGALCIMDTKPRTLTKTEGLILRDLALWIQSELQNDEERARATAVHRALLPTAIPRIPEYEVSGVCVPSQAVGGDFYDWYLTKDDQLVMTVADVMGKGMGAAMVMATVRTVLKLIARTPVLADALQDAAQVLDEDLNRTASFVTLFDARLTRDSGEIEYVDAGLGLALILRGDGRFERLSVRGLPLGIDSHARWRSGYERLEVGDALVIFSDGIYDALGGTDASFGQIARALFAASTLDEGIRILIDGIGDRPAADDVTIIAVRRNSYHRA
ncbi:MAG: SpoIIE family protein phosphatase [Acidobacteriota bacterium]|nr:SpoIIE family protein phosphatase [Acidobacteriota bacterium]